MSEDRDYEMTVTPVVGEGLYVHVECAGCKSKAIRIAELEAELAAVGSDLQDQVEYTVTLRERAEQAEDDHAAVAKAYDERYSELIKLRAELAALKAEPRDALQDGSNEPDELTALKARNEVQRVHIEELLAELAALRAGHCTNPYFDHGTPCDRWVAREETAT